MLNTHIFAYIIFFDPTNNSKKWYCYFRHFTAEETKYLENLSKFSKVIPQ